MGTGRLLWKAVTKEGTGGLAAAVPQESRGQPSMGLEPALC